MVTTSSTAGNTAAVALVLLWESNPTQPSAHQYCELLLCGKPNPTQYGNVRNMGMH